MNRKNRLKGISLLLTAALLAGGCGQEAVTETETSTAAVAVKAVSPEVGTLTVSNQFVGTVTPQQQVSIVPLVSGVVDAVYAEVGDEVKAGEILFHIEDEAAILQAESANASKKSAEASAKMQLGSGQVMNNISMGSNIRSIEYQIEMARDQFNSAVNGVQEAEDAKDDMKKAKREINDSIDSLRDSSKEMENVISEAKNYIEPTGVNKWEFKTVYDHPYAPDHYLNWKGSGEDSSEDPVNQIPYNAPEEESPATPEGSQGSEEEQTTAPEETESRETESGEAQGSVSTEETETTTSNDQGKQEPSNGDTEKKESESESREPHSTEGNGTETKAGSSQSGDESKSGSGEDTLEARAAGTANEAPFAYFSVELIKETAPVYLAAADEGTIPDFGNTTIEEAWKAYEEQQKINSLKKKTEKMGFSPSDIMTGKADSAMVEYAAKIAMLEYQSSQIDSSEASLESSIKSGETAQSTTKKTIDFYEDNLKDAQTTYGIQNGQAYQDTAEVLAAQLAAADVGVKSAALQLEYYSPTSPISGTVVNKGIELHGLAQPGYAAYVISNQDAMNVTFMVSGQVRNSLQEGMKITLEKDGETHEGTITEIGEAVDAQSGGMFTVKAVTEVSGDKLISGEAVKLTVDTFRTDNAVLIPYDALHFESEKAYVFRIVDGKAVRTEVTVGLMSDDKVEITEGLTADSKIIPSWSSQLEDGVAVRIIGEQEAAE